MDNLQMNRLNFSKMVHSHMNRYMDEQYPVRIPRYSKDNSYGITKDVDSANIQSNINSIVAYVHNQLKEQKPSAKNKTMAKSKQPKEIKHKHSVPKGHEDQTKFAMSIPDPAYVKKVSNGNVIIDNIESRQKPIIIDNPANKKISIPRIKALCSHKEKKRQHHTVPPANDTNNYVNMKRFDEAKRQNEAFESMLQDQKQLQHDRQSIAQEIYTMRGYLDNIRGRLNSCLKKLVDSKTYSECNAEKDSDNNEKVKTPKSRQQKQPVVAAKKISKK